MRVADYVVERLGSEGVKHVYSVTGRGSLFLTDAVAKSKHVELIATHHEQGAAYAAVAEAQLTGQLSLCVVSTGCATTNAISGVLSAWQDAVPTVFVSGQNTLGETTRFTGAPLRTFGQQETDIVRIVESITKFSTMLTRASDIAMVLDEAIFWALNGRKGPVWIDIPLDLQSASIEINDLERWTAPVAESFGDSDELKILAEMLSQSSRPLILIGSGVRSTNSVGLVREFIETHEIPCVFTAAASDTYGSANELSIGSVGALGCSRAGNFALQNCDLLLAIGSRLGSGTTGTDLPAFAREARIVVLDLDDQEHQKPSVDIDRMFVGDLPTMLGKILELPLSLDINEWQHKCQEWKRAFPALVLERGKEDLVDLYSLSAALSDELSTDAALVTDSGLIELILPTNTAFSNSQRSIHPASQGAMGYALPASVGVALSTSGEVVVVVGDGSIMMNLQELQTISHLELPIKILIVNNGVYAIIRRRQSELFKGRTIGTDSSNGVSCPDFERVAETFGMPYYRINSESELDQLLGAFLSSEGPAICEVMGKPDQEYVRVAHAVLANRKHVLRPLEDQAPFLDRDFILAEMIIDPHNL